MLACEFGQRRAAGHTEDVDHSVWLAQEPLKDRRCYRAWGARARWCAVRKLLAFSRRGRDEHSEIHESQRTVALETTPGSSPSSGRC